MDNKRHLLDVRLKLVRSDLSEVPEEGVKSNITHVYASQVLYAWKTRHPCTLVPLGLSLSKELSLLSVP